MALAALMLAACGTTPTVAPKPADTPKKPAYYSDDGPPEKVPDNLASVPDAVPIDEPFHRFANRPYTVFGQTYVPVVNKEPGKERGLASWYGRKFHGQRTASGEPYDMFAMTAAHKTLPIPSFARVTNVQNGKSVVVRINDRGPFHSDRIVDLSYAAAQRIGIAGPGSGMVEVERVFAGQGATPTAAAPAPPLASQTMPIVESPVVAQERAEVFIQLGAFGSADGAESFRQKTMRDLPWILEPFSVQSRDGLHRVRLGPYRSREEADAIAAKVRESLGYAPIVTR